MHPNIVELQRGFRINTLNLVKYAEGVSADEALFRPYDKVNNMVWNLGHICFVRNTIQKLLDSTIKLELYENERNLFLPGTGLFENSAYPRLEFLVDIFKKRGTKIEEILANISDEQLNGDSFVQFHPALKTNENYAFYFYNHETEHLGEIKMLKNIIKRIRE